MRAARAAKVGDPVPSRRDKLIADGTLIIADQSKQAPNNSYCPLTEYRDTEFTCRDCGQKETWTAKQQQWWYEVAKGYIWSGAVRCRECRRLDRLVRKAAQWPLAKKPIVVVMDMEDSRLRRMKRVLGQLDPELVPASRLTTAGWDVGIWHVFPGTRLLSLSSHWLSILERGKRRGEFVQSLLLQRPRRPLLFHGTSSDESREAIELLRREKWKVVEVRESKTDWIESDWRDAVSSLLKLKNAG